MIYRKTVVFIVRFILNTQMHRETKIQRFFSLNVAVNLTTTGT